MNKKKTRFQYMCIAINIIGTVKLVSNITIFKIQTDFVLKERLIMKLQKRKQ